jgi:hypothetical protein
MENRRNSLGINLLLEDKFMNQVTSILLFCDSFMFLNSNVTSSLFIIHTKNNSGVIIDDRNEECNEEIC